MIQKYVSNFFKSIKWSFKQPMNTLLYKYTEENIRYYGQFLAWINTVNFQKVSNHSGLDTFPTILRLLTSVGVTIVWLPTYSSELNPCELVFGWVKNYLKCY
ncbi:hypothetical protein AKO1_004442 [Acrasis kona]|uniref:Tc1-like transposase DDE domain-containing protein n=1 Tax=Acrasis kona TaxID=1008807 RepID=A0AAW2Z422_9EUKA